MSELRVELQSHRERYAPGDVVRGTCYWSGRDAPRRLSIHLFWYTLGKGTQDVSIVDEIQVDDPARTGSQDFAFTLPDAPLSYSGKLVSIRWAIELLASGASSARADLELAAEASRPTELATN